MIYAHKKSSFSNNYMKVNHVKNTISNIHRGKFFKQIKNMNYCFQAIKYVKKY